MFLPFLCEDLTFTCNIHTKLLVYFKFTGNTHTRPEIYDKMLILNKILEIDYNEAGENVKKFRHK